MELNTVGLMDLVHSHQKLTYKGAEPSLRELARDMEISPSTFTRLRQQQNVTATNLIRIINWLWARGNTPDQIMRKIVGIGIQPKRKPAK